MREIKFRAWNYNKKKMVIDGLTMDYSNEYGFDNLYDKEGNQIEEYRIMQYTGLKDKNGKEIYEGDIVLWTNKNHDRTLKTEVEFRGGTFFIGPLETTEDDEPEVIGNIYENPELLKQ